MRILHTADWHAGKTMRGRPRLEEQEAVLGEIVALARQREVDLVLVAGDLFESAAPIAEAQALVWRTFLELKKTGAVVVAVAGNHDHHGQLAALAPILEELGIRLQADVAPPDEGGLLEVAVRGGQRARIAMLPFLSQREVIRAADLFAKDASDTTAMYGDRVRGILNALTAGFRADSVNLVLAHAYVRGAVAAGGEREAQIHGDYAVDAAAFPPQVQYAALGHLHATQRVPGPCPIWYPGSPIQVDFGEEKDVKHVLLVEVDPGQPAKVERVKLTRGRKLLTVRGTMDELRRMTGIVGDAYIRVYVNERPRAGLDEEVRELLGPGTVEVRIDHPDADAERKPRDERGTERGPRELFSAYLASQGVADARLQVLFGKLLDDELACVR